MSVICDVIKAALTNDEGALIGRNGNIEIEQMIHINVNTLGELERNAGIFPISQQNIFYKWQAASISATKAADVLATGWYYSPLKEIEPHALKEWQVKATQIPLRSLEPYYSPPENQWTRLLSGNKVAVVTCFTKTAAMQVQRLDAIWPNEVLPLDNIKWSWIQTGHPRSVAQGINEWPLHIHSWQQAADYVVGEVMKSGARFALIGCGGLGMPIAHMLK